MFQCAGLGETASTCWSHGRKAGQRAGCLMSEMGLSRNQKTGQTRVVAGTRANSPLLRLFALLKVK
jgi:hypothetical protein